MPNRKFSSPAYRYGFNGMEKDDELKGNGNSYDYGARLYDPRLGRWLAADPLEAKYVGWSPYNYAKDSPISVTDIDGERVFFVTGAGNDQDGWNYTARFKKIWTKKGIKGFKRINATAGGAEDLIFTATKRSTSFEIVRTGTIEKGGTIKNPGIKIQRVSNKKITQAVNDILNDLSKNPLAEGEQLNLAGYSYGSVLQAHVALALADKGMVVDNLILIGSPIPSDSELFKTLEQNPNIKNVIREDIEGDNLSNPKSTAEFAQGIWDGIVLGDAAPHLDLARPDDPSTPDVDEGKETDSAVEKVATKLIDAGVE